MKRYVLSLVAVASLATLSFAAETNEVTKIRVTGDRVSLRAAAAPTAGLLDQAMRGEEFVYYGAENGWAEIAAPDRLDYWVSGKYIEGGVVVPEKLNVRWGPSGNYSVVNVVHRGDKLIIRGDFNGWIKIAPPADSRIFISDKYVEVVKPVEPKPVVAEKAPEPKKIEEPVKVVRGSYEKKDSESQPLMLVIDKNRKQGEYDEIPGVLRRANPGLYKLVLIDGDIEEPICLVRGNQSQLDKYLNRYILIKGEKYWAKNVELPLLKPSKIYLDPLVVD